MLPSLDDATRISGSFCDSTKSMVIIPSVIGTISPPAPSTSTLSYLDARYWVSAAIFCVSMVLFSRLAARRGDAGIRNR